MATYPYKDSQLSIAQRVSDLLERARQVRHWTRQAGVLFIVNDRPDIARVVDVTHATDFPTVNKQQHGNVKIGHGPTVTHGGCNHPEVVAAPERRRTP